ncbi:MAG: hypothetical protein NTU64_13345 [Hyphomicrobiales bacterium]|nr:hypothetical protein [Hyphomicrobiales bacterium]
MQQAIGWNRVSQDRGAAAGRKIPAKYRQNTGLRFIADFSEKFTYSA